MGYCMSQMKGKFMLKNENVSGAWKTVKELFKEEKEIGWATQDEIENCSSFEQVMDVCSFKITSNENGDYDSIDFIGEKHGDQDIIFNAMARYVEDGSYIQMLGEDGTIWRWVFENGKCVEKVVNITFE